MENKMRICKCGANEKIDAFPTTGPYCTKCKSDYTRQWRKNNKELAKQRQRDYYKKNKTKINEQKREYNKKNKEKIAKTTKRYYETHRDHCIKMNRRNEAKTPHRTWARKTLHGHKKRGNEIQVTIDQVYKLALNTTTCRYCDRILDFSQDGSKNHSPQPNSPSLDRITNENVLRMDNIQIICHKCNEIKNSMAHDKFIEYCNMIVNKFSSDNHESEGD